MQAIVKQLEEERDAYRAELIDFLRKACDCIMGSDADCSLCPFYFIIICIYFVLYTINCYNYFHIKTYCYWLSYIVNRFKC